MLLTTLRDPTNDIDAKFFTTEVLEGKEKKQGWVSMTMAKYPVVRQLLALAANVPSSGGSPVKDAQEKVARIMGSPMVFSEHFHLQTLGMSEVDVVNGEVSPPADAEMSWGASDSDLAQVSAGLPKCFVSFMELLHGVYVGDFDDEATALAAEKSPKDTLQDDEALGGVSPTLQGKLKEALRLVASAANQYTTCSEEQTVPLVSVRSLKRTVSNPDDAEVAAADKERSQMWDKAREQRRKFVSLQCLPQVTRAKLEAMASKINNTQGSKLGDQHRLYVWSADLVSEAGPRPWKDDATKPNEKDFTLEFLAHLAGPGDFVICFDGRMRASRAKIDAALNIGGKVPEELFIFYTNEGDSSANKIFMGAKLHEGAYVNLPCQRQRLTVSKRSDKFLPEGAESTHCPMFANVPLPAATMFPRISAQEKASIFPNGCSGDPPRSPQPQKWDFGGVPMFWRESKSSDLWEAILGMFSIKHIVDLTPGSGALARAAMSRGLKYTGVVSDAKHLAWLQNTLDTAALRFIAKKGESLYMADLAELITQHYQDCIEDADPTPEVEGLFDDED